MTKIVKSISLDETTIAIANSKKNFSGWVREQLLMDIQYTIPCYFFTVYHTDRKGQIVPKIRALRDFILQVYFADRKLQILHKIKALQDFTLTKVFCST